MTKHQALNNYRWRVAHANYAGQGLANLNSLLGDRTYVVQWRDGRRDVVRVID